MDRHDNAVPDLEEEEGAGGGGAAAAAGAALPGAGNGVGDGEDGGGEHELVGGEPVNEEAGEQQEDNENEGAGEELAAEDGESVDLVADEELGERVLTRDLLRFGRGRGSSYGSEEDEYISYRNIVREYNTRGRIDYTFCNVACGVVFPGDDLESAIKEFCKVALVPGGIYYLMNSIRVTTPVYLIGNGATLIVAASMNNLFTVESRQGAAPVMLMSRSVFLGLNVVVKGDVSCRYLFKTCIPVLFQGCRLKCTTGWCVRASLGLQMVGCAMVGSLGGVMMTNSCSWGEFRCCLFKNCSFGLSVACKLKCRGCMFQDNECSLLLQGGGTIANTCFVGGGGQAVGTVCMCNPHRTPLSRVHVVPSRTHFPIVRECQFVAITMFLGDRPSSTHFSQCVFTNTIMYLEDNAVDKLGLTFNTECNLVVKRAARNATTTRVMTCMCGHRHQCEERTGQDVTRLVLPDRAVYSVDTFYFSSDEE